MTKLESLRPRLTSNRNFVTPLDELSFKKQQGQTRSLDSKTWVKFFICKISSSFKKITLIFKASWIFKPWNICLQRVKTKLNSSKIYFFRIKAVLLNRNDLKCSSTTNIKCLNELIKSQISMSWEPKDVSCVFDNCVTVQRLELLLNRTRFPKSTDNL